MKALTFDSHAKGLLQESCLLAAKRYCFSLKSPPISCLDRRIPLSGRTVFELYLNVIIHFNSNLNSKFNSARNLATNRYRVSLFTTLFTTYYYYLNFTPFCNLAANDKARLSELIILAFRGGGGWFLQSPFMGALIEVGLNRAVGKTSETLPKKVLLCLVR